ncbi:hypothetical protein Y032_0099g3157 [Ancylostoma ceylanicum]|nr:hypothetical protein Y032_0099g3157 [Ancylostoma ceylanicum]
MAFTNTSPIQYPTRAAKPALGTNPISIGVNGTGGDHFLLDMATTTVAIGKVEIAKRRGDPIPESWGVEKGGKLSTDADKIIKGGGLFPLGGSEISGKCLVFLNCSITATLSAYYCAQKHPMLNVRDLHVCTPRLFQRYQRLWRRKTVMEIPGTLGFLESRAKLGYKMFHGVHACYWYQLVLLGAGLSSILGGYKGYGLGAVVEIFCGILAGAHWGPNVRKWMNATSYADLGQCFVAVDPEAFAPGFFERMQELINTLRSLPPYDGKLNVLVAGDPEDKHVKLVKELGGIPYHPNQIKNCDVLSEKLNVKKVKVAKEY